MRNEELIAYITKGRKHPINDSLMFWFLRCNNFRNFVQNYQNKIRKKVQESKNDEDLQDIQFELAIAYLFLSSPGNFQVEYEKYGTERRSPDFTVTFPSSNPREAVEFNVEVKRFRELERVVRFNNVIRAIAKEVEKMYSSLAFSFSHGTVECPDLTEHPNLIEHLESNKDQIIEYIKKLIQQEQNHLPINMRKQYSLPGCEKYLFGIYLTKPGTKPDPETSYYGGTFPAFYTSRDFLKFGSIILKEKLDQMLEGKINLLFIVSDSSIYKPAHLSTAIHTIYSKVVEGDEAFFIDKKFEGIKDFLSQSKHLSSVLFKNNWIYEGKTENLIWYNSQKETLQIPAEIKSYLQEIAERRDIGIFY